MALYDDSSSLEAFRLKAQSVSQHLTVVTSEGNYTPDTSPQLDFPASEPMQIDEYHLSAGERQHRLLRGQ